jgi:hypothetical protein
MTKEIVNENNLHSNYETVSKTTLGKSQVNYLSFEPDSHHKQKKAHK